MRAVKNIRKPFKRYERSIEQPVPSDQDEVTQEDQVKIYADITANHGYAPVKLKTVHNQEPDTSEPTRNAPAAEKSNKRKPIQ